MFFDIFEKLCKDKGVTPAQVRKDLGIKQSTMAMWKSRGLRPSGDTLTKLSHYFGVTIAYMLARSEDPHGYGFVEKDPEEHKRERFAFYKFINSLGYDFSGTSVLRDIKTGEEWHISFADELQLESDLRELAKERIEELIGEVKQETVEYERRKAEYEKYKAEYEKFKKENPQ